MGQRGVPARDSRKERSGKAPRKAASKEETELPEELNLLRVGEPTAENLLSVGGGTLRDCLLSAGDLPEEQGRDLTGGKRIGAELPRGGSIFVEVTRNLLSQLWPLALHRLLVLRQGFLAGITSTQGLGGKNLRERKGVKEIGISKYTGWTQKERKTG